MEAAIRFSQNSLPGQEHQYFLKIDIAGRSLQLYNLGHVGKSDIKYELVHSSKVSSPFRAFDWHPSEATLVAVGQTGGETRLVNLATPDQKPLSFNSKSPRSCNAVALNTSDWIAVGLDKARTDYGLYIWDVNRHVNTVGKGHKNASTPIHKVASGEHITSLRFFQDNPRLLATGVQGSVRLYDLRDSNPSAALQFSTKCVNNIAIDNKDENYIASCLPSNTPTVAVWDRRMANRTDSAYVGFGNTVGEVQRPDVSLELVGVADPNSHIFGLRFSKTHRGHLGVLSSTGQLKVFNFHRIDSQEKPAREQQLPVEWSNQDPQDIFLDNIQRISNRATKPSDDDDEHRLHSFDFTTATSSRGRPTIIALDKTGEISVQSVTVSDFHASLSSAYLLGGRTMANANLPASETKSTNAKDPDKPADSLDGHEISEIGSRLSVPRQRCVDGYLLDATKNRSLAGSDEKIKALWTWLEHAQAISAGGALNEGEIDLSYVGVCDLWMEGIDVQSRALRNSFTLERPHISVTIKDAAKRLNLNFGKRNLTEYPHHRALCLHVLGVPWSKTEIQTGCDRLLLEGQLTKAAAIALFSGEEKMAQKALRFKGSGKSHKMLAMALMSSHSRRQKSRRPSHGSSRSREDSETDSQDEEWLDILSAVAEDLTDCYSKSVLAYIRTNNWSDVVSQTCLPLIYRIMVALRHFDDENLTSLLPKLQTQAIQSGDLEGIVLTGLGSTSGMNLLTRYSKMTSDVQTTTLAMSFAAAGDRFLSAHASHIRTIQCFRGVYRSQLMSWGLMFDKARFDIAVARAIREHNLSSAPRKKEQIRLVCSHCSQSLSQFGHDQDISDRQMITTETAKHPLTPAKAAVVGTVCPKCGRHLPRCGVCDMWLGTPDETFSKWYKQPNSSQRNSNNADLSGSMVGSTVTAIGPGAGTPTISGPVGHGASGKAISKRLTTADLVPSVVEVVDENVAKQQREKRWYEAMHKFTVFCTRCSHGFHAEHARMWFGGDGEIGRHNVCPVPQCECMCNT